MSSTQSSTRAETRFAALREQGHREIWRLERCTMHKLDLGRSDEGQAVSAVSTHTAILQNIFYKDKKLIKSKNGI
ncbi:hypothetical protein J6590_027222 [Homalodisca vitripennis]|nr:hypothetical protein J6590_027222 [Homalodisca vitripennis]